MDNYIILNGEKKKLNDSDEIFISDLVNEFVGNYNTQIAIAINFKVICRSKWCSTKIKKNDRIEIVSAFTGG